ncbi:MULTISPECIES: 50S ribosomal protein L24 [Lactobacillus]|uniref:Large ribosomal subunit protein uL24 n=1 Tax=Lactobacillus melliventris TaxID=1218507 RepID=A0A0F4LB36_9LACO|nr:MULTISPECIES: 50S ribosomal protein L24 [Lactobacillus]MCT6892121.1 50S ribosomal protein L24 [Lactobacillus sp.]KJY56047.1 50S ribosomal protein L24 [Lactobacillus melliventris]MBC6349129.1 50S ribosomal protein L24 [Lactobacillus melliventris]MBH9989761.1 50S ribosomal protein L24 [Lactobacillus sp. M0392]MBI0024194.1 50S ribosomal protein L24 [Lactobacillus sp. W8171]
MFVKTGDKVKVIAGKDKGKEGIVLSVNVKKNRVVVKGVNKIKKHQKPSQTNANGGVVESEGSIHASNVKVIAKSEGKANDNKEETKK